MQFDAERMARLAGISESDPEIRGSAPLDERRVLREYFEGSVDEGEDEDLDEGEDIDEGEDAEASGPDKMTEARLRKIISREIRSAIEELRKSRGKPIAQIRKRSRLV